MTRTAISKGVATGELYSASVKSYKDKFMFGGIKNFCGPNIFVKYGNVMAIQRQTLMNSWRTTASKFRTLQAADVVTKSNGKAEYHRARKELLEDCVFRMVR